MTLRLHKTGIEFPDGSWQMTAGNGLPYRNLIINGDMRIAQRGTVATGITTNGYHTVDRFGRLQTGDGTWTMSQETDAPDGFSNSLKMECTTADATLDAGDRLFLRQGIEGQNLQHLKFGTENVESLTLSFWVKTNKIGNYSLSFINAPNTRSYVTTYTVSSANTWEYKTITIDGDTVSGFDNDNNVGMWVYWNFRAGSAWGGGSVNNVWESTNNPNLGAGTTVDLADTVGNYINITGVQLEVGETTTPFEHRPYDIELTRCKRYYHYLDDENTNNQVINTGFMYDEDRARMFVTFPTTMRTKPVVGSTNIASSFEFNINGTDVFVPSFSLPFASAVSVNGALLQGTADSGTGTGGETRYVRIVNSNAKIEFGADF